MMSASSKINLPYSELSCTYSVGNTSKIKFVSTFKITKMKKYLGLL